MVAKSPLPKLAPKPAREAAEKGGKPPRALEVVKPDKRMKSEDEAAASAEVVSLDAFRKKS